MFDMMNNQYYKSLSDDIRDRVRECGLIFYTEEDLRKFIEELEG